MSQDTQDTEVTNNQRLSEVKKRLFDEGKLKEIKELFNEIYEKVSDNERKYLIKIVDKISKINDFDSKLLKVELPKNYIMDNSHDNLELSCLCFLTVYLYKFKKCREFKEESIKYRLDNGNNEEVPFSFGECFQLYEYIFLKQEYIKKEHSDLCYEMFNALHHEYYDPKTDLDNFKCRVENFEIVKIINFFTEKK